MPKLWFRRCDGTIFKFDELSQASVAPQINTIDINGGWSLFPLAQLPGQSTLEMQFSSAKFEADLFSMTNATKFEKEDFQIYLTERAVPTVASSASTGTIELHHKVAQDKAGVYMITVGNLTLDTATGAGKFTLANDPTEDKCILTFDEGDCDGTEFEVNYAYEQNVEVANITNKNTAIGEAVLKYPVKIAA